MKQDLATIQLEMFGCSKALIDHDVVEARNAGDSRRPVNMMVMGLLSDAQELIARNDGASAERLINRAKYLVDEYLGEKQ